MRLIHIQEAISGLLGYVEKVEYEAFDQDPMRLDACLRKLEVIGEAANHLSESLQTAHSHIAWGKVVGLRNLLIHQYFRVDSEIIWNIIQHDILLFQQQIEHLIKTLP